MKKNLTFNIQDKYNCANKINNINIYNTNLIYQNLKLKI